MSVALVLSHPFIARLQGFLAASADARLDLNFNMQEISVIIKGVSGRSIAGVYNQDIQDTERWQPDIIYLELGSNDLCDLAVTPVVLVERMLIFSRCKFVQNSRRFCEHSIIIAFVVDAISICINYGL